jgi:pimeloyl-ACP methyl ester carboxylesterase
MNIPTPDGLRLNVRVHGHGPCRLLFIHGFGDGGFVWDPIVRKLGPVATAALDLRGHGDSQWDPLQCYSVNDHVEDASEVFEALRLDDTVLVGHSLGAEVALWLAVRFAKRVKGLALVDWGPEPNFQSMELVRSQFSGQQRQYASIHEYAAVLAERLPLADRTVLLSYATHALKVTDRGTLELKCDPGLALPSPNPDPAALRACLASVGRPILMVRGAISGVLPDRVARRVVAQTPACQLRVVRNAGHAVLLDNPAGLSDALGEFLRSLEFAAEPRRAAPVSLIA